MKEKPPAKVESPDKHSCGIVMPISAFADYTSAHWSEVREIIERAIVAADMEARPVWQSSDTDIIQGRIVRNLHECPMVVCDISGLNPNVMFELGMRLTFRKPVIVVSDGLTRLPFDTAVIDTLMYPADLHFPSIEKFIHELTTRLMDLSAAAQSGCFTPYLDTFGTFEVVDPPPEHVPFNAHLANQLERIESKLSKLDRQATYSGVPPRPLFGGTPRNALAHYADESGNPQDLLNSAIRAALRETENEESGRAPTKGWTEERVALLRTMWEAGSTASEIADALGGVSRNVVIGKAHRLGLKSRPAPPKS